MIQVLSEQSSAWPEPPDGYQEVVVRPWGTYQGIHRGSSHQVKHIVVDSGETLSYQYHRHRHEHWVVVSGVADVTINDEVTRLGCNEGVFVPLGAKHR